MKKNENFVSLETSLNELNRIVDNLEADETTLKETMKLYEDGLKLIKFCESEIEIAEKKIKILNKENDKFIEEDL
tara:strand:+ start:1873 stop:2097 length:225 start_codon:yes stop_codon:yes gene_type:complete